MAEDFVSVIMGVPAVLIGAGYLLGKNDMAPDPDVAAATGKFDFYNMKNYIKYERCIYFCIGIVSTLGVLFAVRSVSRN